MKDLLVRVSVVLFVLLICGLSMWPPKDRIRLGRDLRGGVSLIYSVKVPDDADRQETMTQVIDGLKRRVNPDGTIDISIQQIGRDRLEIVMPLPNKEVLELQKAYQTSLEEVLSRAEIDTEAVREALESGNLPSMFPNAGELSAKAEALQAAFESVKAERSELVRLRTEGGDAGAIQSQEFKVATAELTEEKLRENLLSYSLDKNRFIRMLSLPDEPISVVDKDNKNVLDENGKPMVGPSSRQVELGDLKKSFPHLASTMDDVVVAFDKYNSKRNTLDDPEDLKRLLRGAGVLEFHIAVTPSNEQGVNIEDMRRQLRERGPGNTDSVVAGWYEINDLKQWYEKPEQLEALRANPVAYFTQRNLVADESSGRYFLLLYTDPARSMTHEGAQQWSIRNARREADQLGRPAVGFTLDNVGGQLMGRMTAAHINEPMAIVLDNQVYSAPNLLGQINGRGIIQGTFSDDELKYLTRVLVAGTLSARLSSEPISTNILGSSLGEENLWAGLNACVISVVGIAVFMACYYFMAGIFAIIAIAFLTVMIFGVCAMIETSFTLPGLAGMALTAGMAVDSNVLIYERIREEMVNNKENLRTAIRVGFSRAFNAILDGNLTNLVVCLWLVLLATTEVKGFAVVMIVGTVATLFSALFLTRTLLVFYNQVLGAKTLPMLPTAVPAISRILEPNIDWISKRYAFFTLSIVTSIIGIVSLLSLGPNMLDTEFRGGVAATMTTRLARPGESAGQDGRLLLRREDVETELHDIGTQAGPQNPVLHELRNATVLTVGQTVGDFEASSFQIKVANPNSESENDPSDEIVAAIVQKFGDRLNIAPSLTFDGSDGSSDPSQYYFLLNKSRVGDAIGRPDVVQPTGVFTGGVGIVLEHISPPVSLDDVRTRIDRMRRQPDFNNAAGRRSRIIGLDPADPNDRSKGYSSVAILVADNDLNGTSVDLGLWDQKLARDEWRLVTSALKQSQSLDQVSSFSSAVAATLSSQAVVAIVLSLLCIVAYVWFRFNSLRYSIAAIVATIHDVCIAVGMVALSHYVARTAFGRALLIEEFRIDLNVIAALLTLIGYSLNDTVVIMDRIRENRGKLPLATAATINLSINQTMSRTLITGGTTMISLVVLYVLGGPSIRPFSFVLFIGLITGTYSSVAIAAPLVYSRKLSSGPAPQGEGSLSTLPAT